MLILISFANKREPRIGKTLIEKKNEMVEPVLLGSKLTGEYEPWLV